jgi:type 2A phosphatase activator TIP41
MTFGNNSLVLSYSGSSGSSSTSTSAGSAGSSSGAASGDEVQISFNALDALGAVAVGEGWEERVGGGVQVAMADQWGKNRYAFLSQLPRHSSGTASTSESLIHLGQILPRS